MGQPQVAPDHKIQRYVIEEVLPQVRKLLSSEHFSVDGTLIEALASMKSFMPKDGSKPPSGKGRSGDGGRNAEGDFHGSRTAIGSSSMRG